jgi:hypothetical protein
MAIPAQTLAVLHAGKPWTSIKAGLLKRRLKDAKRVTELVKFCLIAR